MKESAVDMELNFYMRNNFKDLFKIIHIKCDLFKYLGIGKFLHIIFIYVYGNSCCIFIFV